MMEVAMSDAMHEDDVKRLAAEMARQMLEEQKEAEQVAKDRALLDALHAMDLPATLASIQEELAERKESDDAQQLVIDKLGQAVGLAVGAVEKGQILAPTRARLLAYGGGAAVGGGGFLYAIAEIIKAVFVGG
jgi:hypothetical protein